MERADKIRQTIINATFIFTALLILITVVSLFYKSLPACDKADQTITIGKETFISNGEVQTNYYIDDVGVWIPSIHFKKPIYKDLKKVEDLNAAIYINDWVIRFGSSHISEGGFLRDGGVCIEFDGKIDLGSQKPPQKVKVVFFSGKVPIGYAFVKTEVEN